MPPDMAISMRHTKLTPEEAALLAGEVQKASWQSKNEGIHERISFEDSIWGFDLAGGSFYNTPLRVTAVKPGSRAEKAGIKPGDKVLRINDIDTSTLTIQEAHEIIIESGVHLRIAVTAPDDEEDAYFCYEDPYEEARLLEEERLRQEDLARKRQVHAKVSSYWSLQWPWVSKRRVIYRESNCFMVPSKYEDNHRDKFSAQPMLRTQDDIVLHSTKSENENKDKVDDTKVTEAKEQPMTNGTMEVDDKLTNGNIVDSNILQMPDGNDDFKIETNETSVLSNKLEENGISETNDVNEDVSDLSEMDDNSQVLSTESKTDKSAEKLNSHEVNNDKQTKEDDDIINEVIEDSMNDISKSEDEILDSILSDSNANEGTNSESIEET